MNLLLYISCLNPGFRNNRNRESNKTIEAAALEGQTASALEPGQDDKPLCFSTDPPGFSGQGTDFQECECMIFMLEVLFSA